MTFRWVWVIVVVTVVTRGLVPVTTSTGFLVRVFGIILTLKLVLQGRQCLVAKLAA